MFSFKKKYKKYSDEELLPLIAKGEEGAFNEFYNRYGSRMHYYFFRMLYQDEERASDFTQDLMVKIIDHAERFDPLRKCSTWVYTIASNMCKNEYRRVERLGARRNLVPLDQLNFKEQISNKTTDHYLPDSLDQELFKKYLEIAVSELEWAHQQCFILRYQEELPVKEISEILNCPEGTVKSRLHYALKKLAIKLKMFHPDNDQDHKKKDDYERQAG